MSLSRYHTYYLTGLVLIYNQLGLTCYAYVRYRLFVLFLLPQMRFKIYLFYIYEGGIQMKNYENRKCKG